MDRGARWRSWSSQQKSGSGDVLRDAWSRCRRSRPAVVVAAARCPPLPPSVSIAPSPTPWSRCRHRRPSHMPVSCRKGSAPASVAARSPLRAFRRPGCQEDVSPVTEPPILTLCLILKGLSQAAGAWSGPLNHYARKFWRRELRQRRYALANAGIRRGLAGSTTSIKTDGFKGRRFHRLGVTDSFADGWAERISRHFPKGGLKLKLIQQWERRRPRSRNQSRRNVLEIPATDPVLRADRGLQRTGPTLKSDQRGQSRRQIPADRRGKQYLAPWCGPTIVLYNRSWAEGRDQDTPKGAFAVYRDLRRHRREDRRRAHLSAPRPERCGTSSTG